MSRLENQYSTGKKILKPSDDPIIAVRALKLRSNLAELDQYVEKNIPDAESWMEVTESAMNNVNAIIKKMNTYCVQGATDTLTAENRTSILENLNKLTGQIYQEGNSQYAGRYVFTGFKTDTPLIYTSAQKYNVENSTTTKPVTTVTPKTNCNIINLDEINEKINKLDSVTVNGTTLNDIITVSSAEFEDINFTPAVDKVYYIRDTNQVAIGANTSVAVGDDVTIKGDEFIGYHITESLTGKDIEMYKTVVTPENASEAPRMVQAKRLQLAYNDLYTQTTKDVAGDSVTTSALTSISYTVNGITSTINGVKTKFSTEEGAYEPGDNDVFFIADTGELILGKNIAEKMNDATDITVKYEKNSFKESDLRPEHFFTCTFTDEYGKQTKYTQQKQDITYEVNFNQQLKVNTEAKDAITHDTARMMNDITTAVNNVIDIETQIARKKDELTNINLTDAQKKAIEDKIEQLNTSLALNKSVLQETFSKAITQTNKIQDTVNVAVADLGARANRLKLTKSRLEDQQVELEDLKSTNEDADLVETIIRYKSAESIYNGSLSATASVIKTSLLNFL